MARIDYYYRSISTSRQTPKLALIFDKLFESKKETRTGAFPLSIQRVESFESFACVSADILVLIISVSVGMIGGSV